MLTVSDFFCGCGGLSQGFKEAGFKIKTGMACTLTMPTMVI